jgi:RNA polymerase sigma-70 factor (ECF subfamily)
MDDSNRAEPDPDVELMLRLRNGDEAAFDALVARWQDPLLNFLQRSLASREQAEDLAQMVLMRIYQSAPRYEPKARFSTFLFQIARRLLINEFRRSQRKPLESVDPADMVIATDDSSERISAELEEVFEHALAQLPENQRTAILLLKQQELSYQEIADVMGASESAVKTWIYRARQFLKQALKDCV